MYDVVTKTITIHCYALQNFIHLQNFSNSQKGKILLGYPFLWIFVSTITGPLTSYLILPKYLTACFTATFYIKLNLFLPANRMRLLKVDQLRLIFQKLHSLPTSQKMQESKWISFTLILFRFSIPETKFYCFLLTCCSWLL